MRFKDALTKSTRKLGEALDKTLDKTGGIGQTLRKLHAKSFGGSCSSSSTTLFEIIRDAEEHIGGRIPDPA